jgi:hypothetical protein
MGEHDAALSSLTLLFSQVNRVTPHSRLIAAAPTPWITVTTRR